MSPHAQLLGPPTGIEALDFLGGLQTSPLAGDEWGNLYFVAGKKALAMVNPQGDTEILHPPNPHRLFHLITQLAPSREGLLIEVKEGFNEAPAHEQEQGLFILRDPITRLFVFEPQKLRFREIYAGDELQRWVGQFSDGALVNARKLGTRLLIYESRQP